MATSNVNRLQYGGIGGQGVKSLHMPVDAVNFPVHVGDLMYMDQTAHLAKPLDSDAHAATLIGVAAQPSQVSSNLDNGSIPAEKAVVVQSSGVFGLQTTASEVYYPGQPVYAGADAQTITNVTGSNIIGWVILPVGVASITGAAGVSVGVYVRSLIY